MKKKLFHYLPKNDFYKIPGLRLKNQLSYSISILYLCFKIYNINHMNPIPNVKELSNTQVGSYCSNGFRNINYSFSDFSLEEKVLKSNLHVDFSKYSLFEPRLIRQLFQPHLRTTEYVVIAVLMSELYMSLALKISQEDLAKSWIKQIKMKSSPQFAINTLQPISVVRKKFIKLSSHQMESSFEIVIGETIIQLTIAHSNAKEKNIDDCIFSEAYNVFAYFLQNLDFNFYKTGYKSLEHIFQDIKTEPNLMITSAHVRQITSYNRYLGIGTHFTRTMDIASFILISSQLIQVLLYALDQPNCVETDDLWVRSLEINYPAPMSVDHMKEYVKCRFMKEINYKGQFWRVADMRATLGNIQANFDVAYHHDFININEN